MPLAAGRGNTASQPAAGNVRGLAPQAEEVEDEEDGEALFAPLLDVEKMVRALTTLPFAPPHSGRQAEDYQAEAERLCQHAHVASISSQARGFGCSLRFSLTLLARTATAWWLT